MRAQGLLTKQCQRRNTGPTRLVSFSTCTGAGSARKQRRVSTSRQGGSPCGRPGELLPVPLAAPQGPVAAKPKSARCRRKGWLYRQHGMRLTFNCRSLFGPPGFTALLTAFALTGLGGPARSGGTGSGPSSGTTAHGDTIPRYSAPLLPNRPGNAECSSRSGSIGAGIQDHTTTWGPNW